MRKSSPGLSLAKSLADASTKLKNTQELDKEADRPNDDVEDERVLRLKSILLNLGMAKDWCVSSSLDTAAGNGSVLTPSDAAILLSQLAFPNLMPTLMKRSSKAATAAACVYTTMA